MTALFTNLDELQQQVSQEGATPPQAITVPWFLSKLGHLDGELNTDLKNGINYKLSFRGLPMGNIYLSKVNDTKLLSVDKSDCSPNIRGKLLPAEEMNSLYVHADFFGTTFRPHTGNTGKKIGSGLEFCCTLADNHAQKLNCGYLKTVTKGARAFIFDLDRETGETMSFLSLLGNATLAFHVDAQSSNTVTGLKVFVFERKTDDIEDFAKLSLKDALAEVEKRATAKWEFNEDLIMWKEVV